MKKESKKAKDGLPTAEQVLHRHFVPVDPFDNLQILQAMQEYSDQQNAELKNEVERKRVSLVAMFAVERELKERVKELESSVAYLTEIINGINGCRKLSIKWPEELENRVNKLWEEL